MNLEKLAEILIWQMVPELSVQIFKEHEADLLEKGAESDVLRELANLWQVRPGKMLGVVPNAPGPLSSMLVGGMAGAGLGYGAGWLAEKALPNKWKKNRLRHTLAAIGGGLGAVPGAISAAAASSTGRHWNSNALMEAGHTFKPQRQLPPPKFDFTNATGDNPVKISADVRESFTKAALFDGTGVMGAPMIDVNEFNKVIWRDPRVANPMSPVTRAAATGLVNSAANLPGRSQTRFVSPADIGRMAAGMGSGYLSGMLVGKGLGLLMGMPAETQNRLKSTGMWAGIVSNMVPIAFGR